MEKNMQIPFVLKGKNNLLEIEYKENDSVSESGFDALNLPFNPNLCIGYPVVRAFISKSECTGYRRGCGWIQLVNREYYSTEALEQPDENELSIDTNVPNCIYLAFGSFAEIYDAPCNNLNGNCKGKWTAYTYLVDMPGRNNNYELSFLAGFQWGYEEAIINDTLTVKMQEIKEIHLEKWKEHIVFMKTQYPDYNFK